MSNDLELLVRGYVAQVQELDTAAAGLLTKTGIESAEGVQLDGLGEIIGIARNGLSDDDYRTVLFAYIRVNTSGGTIEQLIEVVRLSTNSAVIDQEITLEEFFPAAVKITHEAALPSGVGLIAAQAMFLAKAAGIHVIFEYHETEPIFAFDGAGGAKFNGGYYLKTAIRNRGTRESEVL